MALEHKLLLTYVLFMVARHVKRSPWFKGALGELKMNTAARLLLRRKNYHFLKDVMLPTRDGTTQIDLIIVSRFGVFVIETKNLTGWIFGSEF